MARHQDIVIPGARRYWLKRARVPLCFLRKPIAALPDNEGCVLLDILVDGEQIVALAPSGSLSGAEASGIDLEGRQVWATLLDIHAHLDKGQVLPRVDVPGTLAGAATATIEDRQRWSHEDIAHRMRFGLRCGYVHGVSAIRTHIDSHAELIARSWAVFRELRAEWAGRVELQAVGLVPLTAFATDFAVELADLMVTSGGILGGSTDAIGNYGNAITDEEVDGLLDRVFELAAERELDVDLHVDQTANVAAYSLPNIARTVLRKRFRGRVVCDHCVNLALQPDNVIRQTLDLCAEAGLTFATMPTPMMYLMDREAGRTPRWRGVTLAQELANAGLKVAIGGDNCRDAWFPFGDHDMVDTFQQSVRVFQLDQPLSRAVAMAGPVPAELMRLNTLGALVEGGPARFILFAARSLNEIMCRPQTDRIVIDRGRRVTDALPDYADLDVVFPPTAAASQAFAATGF